jgi:RimJ/RimL family protein N-acetyltransferase
MLFEKRPLQGRHVRLEPITESHKAGLSEAILDGELWKLFFTLVPPPDQLDTFLADAESAFRAGDGLTFATIDSASGRIAGSTRFMRASVADKRVEIGFTFLGNTWQKTALNTEAKLLMLAHAFDDLGMNRVELITDFLNSNSRRAIARLGAKEEGVLRSHRIMPDGRVRDSVIYSILKHEWPGLKQHLLFKLAQRESP